MLLCMLGLSKLVRVYFKYKHNNILSQVFLDVGPVEMVSIISGILST
jgi:hypothetical protein